MYGVISFMFLYPSLKVIILLVISQLADLFWQLEYCEAAAVTPTLELAKLALVTSRDEEEDEADKGGTDSSNDTDATLVEDGPRLPMSEPPNTVLGKRPRDITQEPNAMDVDVLAAESPKEGDGFVIVSQPASPHPQDIPPALE